MKKIILSTLVLTAVFSCKKESQNTGDAATADSLSVNREAESETKAFVPRELSSEEVGKYLATSNDTLYVTNFFATWCGPCMREIPHFKTKMQELKGKPVKFTFINLDDKSEWNSAVKRFAEENNLSDHIILMDGQKMDPNFFTANFKQWNGGSIPFTFMRKGQTTDEYLGMMTEEVLNAKINDLLK